MSIRKKQEIAEEIEKISERKKNADNDIATLERNLNTLQDDNIKLKNALELSEREKKLLEKNMAKVNGNHHSIKINCHFQFTIFRCRTNNQVHRKDEH